MFFVQRGGYATISWNPFALTAEFHQEIRPLFRLLISRWHPDRTRLASKKPLFEALTRQILSAYEKGDCEELRRIDRDGLKCLHTRISTSSKFGPRVPASPPPPAAAGGTEEERYRAASEKWWNESVKTGDFSGAPEPPFIPYTIPWRHIFENLINPYFLVLSAFAWGAGEGTKFSNAASVASGMVWTWAAWQAWLAIGVLDPVHPSAATAIRVLLVLAYLPVGMVMAFIVLFLSVFGLAFWVSNMFLVPILSMIHPALGYAPAVVISLAAIACAWEQLGDEVI